MAASMLGGECLKYRQAPAPARPPSGAPPSPMHQPGARPGATAAAGAVPILAYFRLTPEGTRLTHAASPIGRWWAGMAARESVRATRFEPELA